MSMTSPLVFEEKANFVEYGTPPASGYHCYTYQKDSFAKSLSAVTVVSCIPGSAPEAVDDSSKKTKSKKGKKKKKKVPTTLWFDVVLSDTVLFAEGGGQPTDNGTLLQHDTGLQYTVRRVDRNDDGTVTHKVCIESSALAQSAPLNAGAVCDVHLDWNTRWDQMQQHSGQHLISAVFRRRLGARTLSWNMATWPKPSTIELELDSELLTVETLAKMETEINELLKASRKVTAHVFHSEEALDAFRLEKALGRRKQIAEAKTRNGPLRIVEMDGIELNTCCGTHVAATSQLQMLKLLPATGSQLAFVCGQRLAKHLSRMFASERTLTLALTCAPQEFAANVQKLQSDLKAKTSELRALQKRLVQLEADTAVCELLRKSQGSEGATVRFHLVAGGMGTAQAIATAVLGDSRCPPKCALFFAIGQSPHSGHFYLVCTDAAFLSKNKKRILQVIEGRGGGKPGTLQGTAKKLSQAQTLLDLIWKEIAPKRIVYPFGY